MAGPYVTWRVPALYKGRVPGSFVHAPAASRLQGPPQFRDISSCSGPDNGGGREPRARKAAGFTLFFKPCTPRRRSKCAAFFIFAHCAHPTCNAVYTAADSSPGSR
ncbi:hypothetical protein MRX96_058245 [Rhipicephalus microplus]